MSFCHALNAHGEGQHVAVGDAPLALGPHFDARRARMPEGVAQRLARDAVGLVAHDRVQIALCALYLHINGWRVNTR